MATWVDGIIVTVISIGATVLVGILGYLLDKGSDPAERKP